jgi:hypothetical protein
MAANVRFAFAPALAIEGLLDYSKSEHVKIFRCAIKPVSGTPFDCEADGLHQFLKDVHDRADEIGWTKGILRISAEENENEDEDVRENLIDHYGSITLERINNTPCFQDENRKTPVELFANSNVTATPSTGNHLDARYTYWTTNFNPENRFTSGNGEAEWEFTLESHHNMDDRWPWS